MLLRHDGDHEEEKANKLIGTHSVCIAGAGNHSQPGRADDRLSFGLTHLPLLRVIIGMGAQAFAAAQLGMHLDGRTTERYLEAAERLAGIVLIVLGLFLAGQRLLI